MALENHQLVTEDRQLDVAVQIVRGAGDQPHHTTQQEIQPSEQHVPTSHDMKEGRSYERTGRGADRWFLCPSRIEPLLQKIGERAGANPSVSDLDDEILELATAKRCVPCTVLVIHCW